MANLPEVEYDDVISKALEYNSLALNIQRRQLEADYEVAKARGNLREVNLFAQVGYTAPTTPSEPPTTTSRATRWWRWAYQFHCSTGASARAR